MRDHPTRMAALLAVLMLPLAGASGAELAVRSLSEAGDGSRMVVELQIPPPSRTELEADGRAWTQLDFPGMRVEGEPGEPALPVATRWIAVPAGGRAEVRVLEAQVEDLGVLRLVPRAFSFLEEDPTGRQGPMPREEIRDVPERYLAVAPREDIVRIGAHGVLRHQDVVALEIRPLRFDPATGATQLVRRVRVEIAVRGGTLPEPGAAQAALEATSPAWQRIYDGLLLNPRSARAWRRAPTRHEVTGVPLASGLLRPGLLGEDQWKIRVRATGPVRVLGSTLLAAQLPGGTPIGRLRLALRRWSPSRPLEPDVIEIPIQVQDVDGDGIFDVEDSFLFYGQHPRDDASSEDTLARYTQENVYWLSVVESGFPARMPEPVPVPGAVPGPTSFGQQLVYEEDLVQNEQVYGSNFEAGDTSELYFWRGRLFSTRVLVPVPGRSPGAAIEVCVETQEDHAARPYQLFVRSGSRDSVLLGTDGGTQPRPPSNSAPNRRGICGSAADSQVDPGDLWVILRPLAANGVTPYWDLVRLQYSAQYVASGNRIRCTSGGASGPTAFAISGFTDPNLRAFDVTDPKSPRAFDLTGAYSGGTLRLTDDLPAGTTRVYLVVPNATIPTLAVERDEPDDILGELATAPHGSYQGLVIAHDSFAALPKLAEWVAWRASQGLRLRVIRTSDVYDAFRGGLQHYEAIHRLCQLAFENWGVEYVVLVGDGSEDTVRLSGQSGPNFVPARVRYFYVQPSAGGGYEYRNDMNDKYYAQVAGGPFDPFPDLLLGRLPVGDEAQLAAVLDKTMRYETPAPDDDGRWRKRVVMYSDDEWVVRTVSGLNRHKRGCSEIRFQRSVERAGATVDQAFPGDLVHVPFLLRNYSDQLGVPRGTSPPITPLHRPVPIDSTCWYELRGGQPHGIDFAEFDFYHGLDDGEVARALIDSIGAGALFFALQSHMNRQVVGDESIMDAVVQPFAPPFYNVGKPFVTFGFGCHMNEYGPANENGDIRPGDALGENLVTVPERGAVGCYASTGYEFLDQNAGFHEGMWNLIFNKRFEVEVGGGRVDSDTIAARWVLTELLTMAEMQYADSDMISRYVLLGDPMLRLDAGVPRVSVDRVDNGFLQPNNRFVIFDPAQPLGIQLTLRDEQGIDSLWVVKRFPGPPRVEVPIDSVTVVAVVDTAPQIRAKRGYQVSFRVRVDECNFDIVVGARDLAGRRSEFVGGVLFDSALMANGLPIDSGARVDPRTAFRFEIRGCAPIPPPLPLAILVDGAPLPPEDVVLRPDSVNVNWHADFVLDLAGGNHDLRFLYQGREIAAYQVAVGGFGMSEVIAFPNPLRKHDELMRIYFHLGEPIAGGHLRVVDVNGRTVLREDLGVPGVVKSDVAVPPGAIGSGVGQDATHWNYVEILRQGRDAAGDALANGVYLYELFIEGLGGQSQRKRDKLVIMR